MFTSAHLKIKILVAPFMTAEKKKSVVAGFSTLAHRLEYNHFTTSLASQLSGWNQHIPAEFL